MEMIYLMCISVLGFIIGALIVIVRRQYKIIQGHIETLKEQDRILNKLTDKLIKITAKIK